MCKLCVMDARKAIYSVSDVYISQMLKQRFVQQFDLSDLSQIPDKGKLSLLFVSDWRVMSKNIS